MKPRSAAQELATVNVSAGVDPSSPYALYEDRAVKTGSVPTPGGQGDLAKNVSWPPVDAARLALGMAVVYRSE